ncbi:MAG TPA: phosphatase PAP2 family protein [Tepidisphaeraceae bacterium]|jgi:undecaprenyl-diphosphatase|nr:phosphatase PAP2 family protein [Tepidisphaeraceae bacterium]
MDFIRRVASYLGSYSPLVLVGMLVVVASVYGFIELTDDVQEGDTTHFDERAIAWMHENTGPRWLQIMGRDVTALGGVIVLAGMTLVVAGYFMLVRQYHVIVLLLVATIGGAALNTGLKHFIGRDRPPEEGRAVAEISKSFPSGHAMLSAAVYLTLGVLLARMAKSRKVKIYFLSLAVLITVLVGVSRVYLRVHWPTDVLAGWVVGLAWAILLWLVATFLQRHRMIEQDGRDTDDMPTETA